MYINVNQICQSCHTKASISWHASLMSYRRLDCRSIFDAGRVRHRIQARYLVAVQTSKLRYTTSKRSLFLACAWCAGLEDIGKRLIVTFNVDGICYHNRACGVPCRVFDRPIAYTNSPPRPNRTAARGMHVIIVYVTMYRLDRHASILRPIEGPLHLC